jgi:hypothetical protein
MGKVSRHFVPANQGMLVAISSCFKSIGAMRNTVIIGIYLAVVLAGCSAQAGSLPASTTAPPPSVAAATSPAVTVAASPSASEVQTQSVGSVATPDFLQLPLANDILFAPSSHPDCKLPCWQGLQVGVSGRDDIQKVFDTAFEFKGAVDLFGAQPTLPDYLTVVSPGFRTTGFQWHYGNNKEAGFGIEFVVDDKTQILQGIYFNNSPMGRYRVHTPTDVINHLGKPDYIHMAITISTGGEPSKEVFVELLMLYKAGLAFYYRDFPKPLPTNPDSFEPFCLNNSDIHADYYLVSPFDLSMSNATPLQKEWFLDDVTKGEYVPIEKLLGYDAAHFSEIALSQNPCLALDYLKSAP